MKTRRLATALAPTLLTTKQAKRLRRLRGHRNILGPYLPERRSLELKRLSEACRALLALKPRHERVVTPDDLREFGLSLAKFTTLLSERIHEAKATASRHNFKGKPDRQSSSALRGGIGVGSRVLRKPAKLNESFKIWLELMRLSHKARGIPGDALARALGLSPETLYRVIGGTRPGVFTAETLDAMEGATGIPAYRIVEAIQTGKILDVIPKTDAEASG